MKRRITIVCIIIAVIVAGIIVAKQYQSAQAEKRTDADYALAITSVYPSMLDANNQPVFTVTSVARIQDNWYVVKIKSRTNGDVSRAIISDDGAPVKNLKLITGPTAALTGNNNTGDVVVPSVILKKAYEI